MQYCEIFHFFKAALSLIAKHAEQFDELIYNDSSHHLANKKNRDLFELITEWTQHKNYDLKKVAYLALDSYYKQVNSIYLKIKIK
jgi:hypothetical protein